MALNLPYGIKPVVPLSNIDKDRYGPWNNLSEALTATQGTRELGLTVGVIEDSKVVEYWFREGTSDIHLIKKTTDDSLKTDFTNLPDKTNAILDTDTVPIRGTETEKITTLNLANYILTKLTGDEIVSLLEDLIGNNRLDYNSLKNTLTGEQIVSLLEDLIGNNRLDASAIKNIPSPDDKLDKDFSSFDNSPGVSKNELVAIYDEIRDENYKIAIKDLAPDLKDTNIESTKNLPTVGLVIGDSLDNITEAFDTKLGNLNNTDVVLQQQINNIIEASPVSFAKYFTDSVVNVNGTNYRLMVESAGSGSAVNISQSVTGTSTANANIIGVWIADNPADANFPVAQQVSIGQLQLRKSTGSGRVLNVYAEAYNMKPDGTTELIGVSDPFIVTGTNFSDYNYYIPINAFTAGVGDRSRIEIKCFYTGSGVAFNAVLKIQEDYVSKWSYSIPVSALSHDDTHITASNNHIDLGVTAGENYDSVLTKVNNIVKNKVNKITYPTVRIKSSISTMQAIVNNMDGDITIIDTTGEIYEYDSEVTLGIKPNNVLATEPGRWVLVVPHKVGEAPIDGNQYARKDGEWEAVDIGDTSKWEAEQFEKTGYGALYNWYALENSLSHGGLIDGFSVPDETIWSLLFNHLGLTDSKQIKSQRNSSSHIHPRWAFFSNETVGTNSSGLNSLPAGYRDENGAFVGIGEIGTWSSYTSQTLSNGFLEIYHNNNNLHYTMGSKAYGRSIRLFRALQPEELLLDDGTLLKTVTDADNNVYNVVKLGSLGWLLENLRTTKYVDGVSIQNITDNVEWGSATSGAFCWYNNNSATDGITYNSNIEQDENIESDTLIRPKDGKKVDASHIEGLEQGGHTFEDSTGNVLPTRSVAKAGKGIEFEDDEVGEKTMVKVALNVLEDVYFYETLIFRDIEIFEFTKSQPFKITQVISESGVTASIKIHGTNTDYVINATVAAFDRLDITVDILGTITIKGILV